MMEARSKTLGVVYLFYLCDGDSRSDLDTGCTPNDILAHQPLGL